MSKEFFQTIYKDTVGGTEGFNEVLFVTNAVNKASELKANETDPKMKKALTDFCTLMHSYVQQGYSVRYRADVIPKKFVQIYLSSGAADDLEYGHPLNPSKEIGIWR